MLRLTLCVCAMLVIGQAASAQMTWAPPEALNTNATTDSEGDGWAQVTTDGSGNWVAVWESEEDLSGAGTDADIFVARSTNNGATWTAPALLNTNATTDSGWDYDPQVTTDNAGHWVAVWESRENLSGAGTDYDILVARSTDNGATWTAPALLNTNATTDSGWDVSPQVTTDGWGNWVAVWFSYENLSGAGTDEDIFTARSTDNGATWTAPDLLNTNATTDLMGDYNPQVTTDNAGNWVAVWRSNEDLSGAGTDRDIFVARSTDNGVTWTAPALLNTNATTDLQGDYLPQVTTDNAGNWVAVWQSNTANIGGGIGIDCDILFSMSFLDSVLPQVSSATALDSTTVRAVFDEAMTDDAALVNAANYTFTGGGVALTASAVTRIDATTVDVTVNEMTDGAAYTVDVDTTASGPTDLASNHVDPAHNSTAFTGLGIAPTVSIDSVSPANAKDGDTVTVEVTATDNVAVSGNPLVTLNGNQMACQGFVGDTYTYTLTLPGGSAEGAATIFASADDAAGNSGYDIDTTSLIIDNTAPTAVITRLTASPTGADAVDFEVDFDESVTPTFDSGDVGLTGTLAGSVGISGVDPTYTVTVTLSAPDADGTIGIDVAGPGAVTDLAGNQYAGGSSPLCDIYNWRGFIEQPQSARKYSGDAHTFTVTPDCPGCVMSYQWKWDDASKADALAVSKAGALQGAKTIHDVGDDSPTYNIPDVTGLAGDYWCDVSYGGDIYPSNAATLEVEDHLAIVIQPVGGEYDAGQSHSFTVATTGGYAPLSYTWKKDGSPVSSDAVYAIDPLAGYHSGSYIVEILDDNGDVAISDPPAVLTVAPGVPATVLIGLGLLAGAMALGGLLALRKKK